MKQTLIQISTAILSGLLLASLWEPFAQSNNVWFALVPLLLLIRSKAMSLKRIFLLGLLTGTVSWCAQLSWMLCLTDNGGPWPLVVPALFGLSVVLSLYIALFAVLAVYVRRHLPTTPGVARIAAVVVIEPALWAGCECLRATLFTGFSWNPLALAAVDVLPVMQLAAVGGACAVSALLVAINGAIVTIIERFWGSVTRAEPLQWREKCLLSCESMVPFALFLGVFLFGYSRIAAYDNTPKKRDAVVVVQKTNTPCIFQTAKSIPVWRQGREIADLLPFFKADLWVWPESSVLEEIFPNAVVQWQLRELVRLAETPVLVGGTYLTPDQQYYNAALLVTQEGLDEAQVYGKRHLVPFGEYIPFDKTFPVLKQFCPTGISCDAGEEVAVVKTPSGLKVGPLICFEDTVATVARDSVLAGAELLINMSNDAWYGNSAEPMQHARQAILRCIETGVPMMRSTNQGVNSVVDAVGRMQVIEEGSFPTRIAITEEPFASAYLTWGELAFGGPCVTLLLIVLFTLLMGKCNFRKTVVATSVVLLCCLPRLASANDTFLANADLLPVAEMAVDDGNLTLAERTAQTVLNSFGLAEEERAKAEEVLIRAALKRGEWDTVLKRVEACPQLPANRRLAFTLAAYCGKKDFASVLKGYEEAKVSTDDVWGVTAMRYGLRAAQELNKKLLAADLFKKIQESKGATDVIKAENALAWDAFLPNESSRRALLEAAAKADRGGVFLACALALPKSFASVDSKPALKCLKELLELTGMSSAIEAQLALAVAQLSSDMDERIAYARRAVSVVRDERLRQRALHELGALLCQAPATFDEGIALLNQAVMLNPSTKLAPQIQFQIAETLQALGNPEEALKSYNRYLESYDLPELAVRVRQGKGRLLMTMKRPEEALSLFQEAAEFAQDAATRTTLLIEAAEAATECQRYNCAIGIYRDLMREGVRSDIPLRLARCLEASGDKEAARREYELVRDDVSSSEQDVFVAVMRLSGLLIEKERYTEALAEYSRLLEGLTHEDLRAAALFARGWAYYKTDKLPLAVADFTKVSESEHESAEEARFFLVLCLYRLGDDDGARALAHAYVEAYPESERIPDIMLWLAKSDFNRGDYASAEQGFVDFSVRWPADERVGNALYLAARSAYQNQDYAAAVELIGRLARLAPNSENLPDARFLQAQALVEQARHAEARDLLNALIRRYPTAEWIPAAYGLRGDCFAYTATDDPERYNLALASYQEAVLRLEDDFDASLMYLFRIGRVLERQNRRDDAAEQYTKMIYRVLNDPNLSAMGKQWFQKALIRLRTIELARGNLSAFERLLHRVRRAQIPDLELP